MANVIYRGKTVKFPDDMSEAEIADAMPSVADQIDATLSELESSQADVKSNEPSLIDNAKGLLAKSFSDVASMPIDALKNLAPEQPKMDKYEPSQPSTETNSAFELAQQPTENLLNKAKTDARLEDKYANTLRAPEQPEANFTNIVKGVASSLPQGLETTKQGIRTQFADAIGSEDMLSDAKLKAKRNSLEMESTTPAFETETAQGLYSGATSLIQQIPGMATAIATGNPVPALANAGLMTEAEAYTRYRERGATPQEAITGALGEGITEVLTEMLPMRFLVKKFGKTGASEIVGGFIARDAIPEQVATLTQEAIDTAIANPDKTWGEYLEERPSAAYQTLLATVVQGGAIGGANYVAQKVKGDRLTVGAENANQDDLRAQELQAQYDAQVAQNDAQQAEADAALDNITNPDISVDESIALATKAVDVPINNPEAELSQQLNDDALLREVEQATEAINASDILGDDNVGANIRGEVGVLDRGAVANEFNNSTGSADIASNGIDGVGPSINRESVASDIPTGIDNGTDGALNEQFGNAEQLPQTKEDLTGEPIDKEWTAFSAKSGTLNIPRAEMPQVKAENRGALVNFLNARNITSEQVEVNANELKPTQAEFSPKKVQKAKDFEGGNRSILISSDNHVLDGHHQWLASLEKGETIKAIKLNAPIAKLVEQVKEMPSIEVSTGAKNNKTTSKKRAGTLLATLRNIGGVALSEKQDVTGEQNKFAPGGYNQVFRNDSKASLKGVIESGDLDAYLPPAMRLESNGMNDEAFDSTEAYDYLSERIRNGERVLPYNAEQEIIANEYYGSLEANDADAQSITDDEINILFREAGYDERESNAEATFIEQGNADNGIVSREGTQAGSGTTGQAETRNEVAETPSGNEREGVRPLVESIVKRRAAANQINKSKAFDTYLTAAKDFLNGKEVSASRFKLAASAFKDDAALSEAFTGLEALAKQSRQSKAQAGNSYTDRIATAKTQAELQALANEIQSDSTLTDKQAQDLDDAVMGAIDAFDVNETTTNNVEVNESESINSNGKKPFELTKQDYEKTDIKENKSVYLKVGENKYEVVRNPTPSQMREMKNDAVAKYGRAENGDPVLRSTQDANGNKYYWKAGDAIHNWIEPAISKEFGVDVNQNAFDGKLSHRSVVRKALYEGEVIPENVLSEYPDLVNEVSGIADNKLNEKYKNTDLLGDNTTAKQAIADAEREKDAKRNTGTDNAEEFTLTGSNSEADKAVASGAQDLFSDFVKAPNGSFDFGEITDEMAKAMRRQAGKIRLQSGVQNSDGTGYGLAHIKANHEKQILNAGFDNVEEFVAYVSKNFNEILQAKGGQLLVAVKNGRKDVMFVQLEPANDGDYYRINTAFPARDNYLDKQENKGMKSLWEGSEPTSTATGKQPLFAADSDNKASQNNPNAKSQSDSETVNSKQDDVNTAIEAIKADATIPSAEKIRLTSELRQGKITPEDVKAVVGESRNGQESNALNDNDNAENDRDKSSNNQGKDATPLTTFDNAMDDYNKGIANVDDYKQAFNSVLANEQAIKDYLNDNFTKAQLFERGGRRLESRYKSEKKIRVVDGLYSEMVSDFLLPSETGMISYSYSYGDERYSNIKSQVEAITQESLDAAMARRKKVIEENKAKRVERLEGMENPETLDDYTNILRSNMNDGMTFKEAYMTLTPEQREIYDDLLATKTMQERESKKDTQKTQVARTSTTTDGEIIETKHTKKGHDLFVVKMAERVSKEDYQAFNANAKKLGGYYSMYRGQGAVPGFQFTERDNAEAFLKLLKGDTTQAESKIVEKRDEFKDDRSQTAVERLNEMADRLEEKADEALNADRKANTARRAGMAARAIANAELQKAMANTMRNISTAIADGKTKFLKNIRQKAQVEMLDSFLSSSRYNHDSKIYDNYSEREKHKDEPYTTEMVDYAEMPSLSLYRQDWGRFGRELLTINGLKQDAKKILDVVDDVSKEYENFAKENLTKVTRFTTKDGALAAFKTKKQAELSIYSSGLEGKATVLAVKRGEYLVILSPSAAIDAGVWQGDNDKRISFKKSFMSDVIKKAENAKVDVPWQLKSNLERLERLERMGIELGAEFRATLREYVTYKDTPEPPSKVKELERKMVGRRNDGLDFFPTPASTADEMIEAAGIEEGMKVLEPSAGMGHIAERVREAGFEPDVVEFSGDRRELLELKGFNVVGNDFLDVNEKYDRIIMNPPFSDRRDMAHVAHAYNLLNENGRLVAIMGEGVFFGSDKKATAFREWLESVGGTSEKLEEGTFNDASLPVNTSVNARMVVIDKTDGNAPMFSQTASLNGMPVDQVQSIVDELKKQYKAIGEVVVVADTSELPISQKLINEIQAKKQQQMKATQEFIKNPSMDNYKQIFSVNVNDIEGAYYKGKIYLNAGNLPSAERVKEVFAHEAIGHLSVENMLDEVDVKLMPKLIKQVQLLDKAGNKYIRKLAANVDSSQPDLNQDNRAKEIIAQIAELDDQNKEIGKIVRSIWQRIMDGIKAFAKLVFDVNLTDRDVRDIVSMADRYAKGENVTDLVKSHDTLFSQSTTPYAKQLSDFMAGKSKGAITIGKTPEALIKAGLPDNKMMVTQSVLDKIVYDHLPMDVVSNLPALLGKPIMVFKSATQEGSFVVVLDAQHKGQPVIAAIKPNGSIERISPVNVLTSGYNKPTGVIEKWLKDGLLIGADKKKALAFATTNGVQFPTVVQQINKSLDLSLSEKSEPVNQANNNGNFDSNNDDIRFSRQGRLTPEWQSLDEESMMDDVIRSLQDKYVDLKRVTQKIKEANGDITDRFDAYLQEELYHGRTAKRVQDFINKDLKPLIDDMRMRSVGMADFEEYLWMRHAPERNEQIAKINEDMPDGGSGVTTAEAESYMQALSPADKKKYEALAKRIDAINKKSRQALIDYGLESPETIAAWEAAYENYVPLMREDMERGFGNGTGTGFKVKGNASKRAMGSNRAVVDIIGNIAQQFEKNVIRGEKNRVATALVGLAKLNPKDGFWSVDTPPTIRHVSKATGLVEMRTDPNYKNRESVVVARIPDKNGRIQERSVVFDEFDDRAMKLARSINNLDVDKVSKVTNFMGSITRYFSSINTQYNPIFGVVNITRDVQGALLNLTTTEIAGKQKDVLKNVLPALRGIYGATRTETGVNNPLQFAFTKKQKAEAQKMRELWEEYQREGGTTGFRDMYANAEERTKAISKALDPQWWTKTLAGKVVTLNGVLTVPESVLKDKAIKPVFDWLSDYNQTLENAVRLAAYKTAIEQGISKQRAASIGKNISVNFNRKGSSTRFMGSLYAFYNAAVQGTARIGETLTGPKGKQIIAGGIGIGAMQAIMLHMMGFDEEEPPEFVRANNFIIPMPTSDKGYVTIPMPLGFNVLPNFGRIATEWTLSGAENTTERVIDMFGAVMESFNPLGGNGRLDSMYTPTALDPLNDLGNNEDWTGRAIAQEDFSGLKPTPGYTRTRDKTWSGYTEVARWINNLSGGDDYEKGGFSPTGDQIDYLVGQLTGGVGREISKSATTAEAIATGEDLPMYKIPLVGRFYGQTKGQAPQSAKFYKNLTTINKIDYAVKARYEAGEDYQEYINDNPEFALVDFGKKVESAIRKARKYKQQLVDENASREKVKEVDETITGYMMQFNDEMDKIKESATSP